MAIQSDIYERITNLTANDREEIRYAVSLAMRYWPNTHLGDQEPLEDMRSAFAMIRANAEHYGSIRNGIAALSTDAYRHADM